jgi:hypothetical protein
MPALNRRMLLVEVPEVWDRNVQEVNIDLPKIFKIKRIKKNLLDESEKDLIAR